MVWIHGGAFQSGSGNSDMYGPEFLLMHDNIVLVTINYRLGLLGELYLIRLNSTTVYQVETKIQNYNLCSDRLQF